MAPRHSLGPVAGAGAVQEWPKGDDERGRPKATAEEPVTDKTAPPDMRHALLAAVARGMSSAKPDEAAFAPFRLSYSKRDRLAYTMDRILAKRWRFFVLLGIWGIFQVMVSGLAYALIWSGKLPEGDPRDDFDPEIWRYMFPESAWEAWTFMADPGTHSKAIRWGERGIGAVITLGGILFFASILGVTVDMIREKMDSLRQGKSRIIERDHTLILGWTEKTFHIIEELCKANESEGGGVVAILANAKKEDMELELELQIPARARRGTRVIFRSGSPLVVGDLLRVGVHLARAVIILSSTGSADQADADTLRTMLSLRSLYDHLKGHVIAEVRDIDNEPLVKLVGAPRVETLVSHDVVGRLMLMSVRQPGLAKVYEALLGFDGDEFYMCDWPELEGCTFDEILFRFPDAIPIGVFAADGVLTLRPPPTLVVGRRDQIIVIAEDNDTYRPAPLADIDAGEPPAQVPEREQKERILFCGWRRDIRDIIQQLDRIVQKGSEVHMITHCIPLEERNRRLMEDGLDIDELQNLSLVHYYGNTSVRRKLEVLPIESYSSCMIFADEAFEQDTLHADSHSLATLLLIRDIQAARGTGAAWGAGVKTVPQVSSASRVSGLVRSITDLTGARCPIICEVLDPHTQKTISNNRHLSLTSDFCQSNKLVAQVLAMIAEDRFVNLLFDELLGNSGCAMAVVPSVRYVQPGEKVSFWVLAKRASKLGELLVGYQMRNSIDKTILNPPNKDKAFLWDRYDLAILRGEVKVSRKDHVRNMVNGFVAQEKRAAIRDGALGGAGTGRTPSGRDVASCCERILEEDSLSSELGGSHALGASASTTPLPFGEVPAAPGQRWEGRLGEKLGGFLQACDRLGDEQRAQLSGLLGALSEAVAARPPPPPSAPSPRRVRGDPSEAPDCACDLPLLPDTDAPAPSVPQGVQPVRLSAVRGARAKAGSPT